MSERGRRVAVTGVGMVTALGVEEAEVRSALYAGRTGIAPLRAFDPGETKASVAAQVDDARLGEEMARHGIRASDRTTDLAMVAAVRALEGAGLRPPEGERRRMPVVFGTGMGPAATTFDTFESFAAGGVRKLRPTTVPRAMYNGTSAALSMGLGLTGPNYMIVSACASATNALGDAYRRIREGRDEAVLCGGADAFLNPLFFGAWSRLGVLSRNPDPERACRPFDADRDGCVLGEGAGALVLEEWERARSRGQAIRGEVLGYGESSDAGHLTRPSEEGQVAAMRAALEDAGVRGGDVAYVNAHGTATPSNDGCEARSIRQALGPGGAAAPVGSLKSYFGHTMGASGAVETIATLLALEAGRAPANLNLDAPDPDCPVRLVGDRPLELAGRIAMKNSFGFGGGNAVLIVGRGES